ncbi:mitogen-activated protein kinase kinase kinase 18-like [Nymphaea colorata]|nr:mitogen-activated protein kinase kinase kinase 18-like [Nymphaea colorata]
MVAMEAMASGWSRGATIGRGSSATVSLATLHHSGSLFAIKSAQLPVAAQLRREHSILASISSPHIVRCLGADVTREGGSEFYNLFMEYFPRGTLCDEIRRQGGRLPEPEIRRHARSVLLGLRYLHGIGIVHRDIKGSNLLLGKDDDVRIGDLGCASRTGVDGDGGGLAGTPLFMAPEVARGQSQGSAADVWALGCTVVEMATGRPPWAGDVTDPVSALYRIGCTNAVPEVPENLSEEGQDFLGKCFCRNPSERWTADQLLQHPFVSKVKEVDIEGKPAFDSPKSILDRDLWDSLESRSTQMASENDSMPVLAPAPTAAGRIRSLFSPASRRPDWSWGENWVCVRAKAPENLSMPSISGEPDFEEPAIESTTGRDIDANSIGVENSAILNDGGLAKVIDGAVDSIHSVEIGTVDDYLIKMQLIEISSKLSLSLSLSLSLYIYIYIFVRMQ